MGDTKKCPYCAETIQAEAVLCRFCNVDLQTGKQYGTEQDENRSSVKARSGVGDGVRIGFGMFIILPLLIVLILIAILVFTGGAGHVLGLFDRRAFPRGEQSTAAYRPPQLDPQKSIEELDEESARNHTNAAVWDAEAVVRSYKDNEVKADQILKDKIMGVAGEIREIGKDPDGIIYVVLVDRKLDKYDDEFKYTDGVWCYFGSSHANEIAPLRVGGYLEVRGICEGKKYKIALRSCVIHLSL